MSQSLARGLTILKLAAANGGELTVTEAADLLRVDPSTSSRLMATLETEGFLQQDPRTHVFSLGPALIEIAGFLERRQNLAGVAHESVQALAAETGETAHMAILIDAEAVFIGRALGRGPITVNTEVGARDPTYCSAIGRALISGLTDAQIRQRLEGVPLRKLTPKTTTDLPGVLDKLATVRELGYAFDDEEANLGIQCIAVPVRDHTGHVVTAIGISGPIDRIQAARPEQLASKVMAAASHISELLGYNANT